MSLLKKIQLSCLQTRSTLRTAAIILTVLNLHSSNASLSNLAQIRMTRASGTEINCVNKDISQCTEMLEVLTKKDIGIAASQHQLIMMCPVLLKGLTCIDNYTQNCLNEEHRRYFNELYAGTIRVIKDLCDTRGTYQNEYLQHAPCMREVNHKYDQCSDVYHEKTAKLNEINKATSRLTESDRRMNVITLCCSFQEYLQCSERIVFEQCGNATASFTKHFLHRMAGPIVQTKCSRYEPGSMVCLSTAVSSATSNFSSFFMLLLFVGLVRFSYIVRNSD